MRAWLCLGLLGIAGCGLSEYEERMDRQRLRIKVFDEENRALDEILEPPMTRASEPDAPTVSAWPFSVYVRLPKDVQAGPPGDDNKFGGKTVYLYRYPNPSTQLNVFVAAALVGEPKLDKQKADKGEPRHVELPTEDFRSYCFQGLKDYYLKTNKVPIPIPAKIQYKPEKKDPRDLRGNLLAPVVYDMFTFTDEAIKGVKEPSDFRTYFLQKGNRQLCILFQVPQRLTRDDAVNRSIEWTLRTLDIGDEADAKRASTANYLQRRKGVR